MGWVRERSKRCGYDCQADLNLGPDGERYEAGVAESRVESCLEKCERSADCLGVNYAAPGKGGSGGPGSTSDSSGCCYYRSSTSCGTKCEVGRTCYTLSGKHPEGGGGSGRPQCAM